MSVSVRQLARPEEFLRSPVGAFVCGRSWLAWCHDSRLTGTALWGRPDEAAARELVAVWEFERSPAIIAPYDTVLDCSRLESVDAAAFEIIAGYIRGRLSDFARRFRRQALVFGSGLAATVVAGFLPAFGAGHEWRAFDDAAAGFAWLGHPAAAEVGADVTRQIEEAAGSDELLRALRPLLAARPAMSAGVAARALGMSERTLQRRLHMAGRSFRQERQNVIIERARALLCDTDAKIEAIARQLGYSSAAHFSDAFRRQTGVAPAEFRARARR
jgi:AraC-like DNA-binding protein